MKAGREVVEDYNATGLTLRPHPVSFLHRELAARGSLPAPRYPGHGTECG